MARGITRTQRSTQASQSQSQSRASQRQRGARDEDEDDNDEGEGQHEDADVEMDADEDGGSELSRRANDLVRLALFSEHKRTPLRREEISKKVLGSHGRSFNVVFELAQRILRATFGMELAELQRDTNADLDAEDGQTGTGLKKKAASSGSKTYILRSALDPLIIEHAALTDERILEEEAADLPDDDDDDDGYTTSYGSLIAWSSADQLGLLGILHVVLALILVSGRVMGDQELRAQLKRLRLPPTAQLPAVAHTTHRTATMDTYLTALQRQGYLSRSRVGDAAGGKKKGAGGGKRARGAPAASQYAGGGDDGVQFEWRWGSRAHGEIGEQGVGRFVAEFMVERTWRAPSEGEGDEEVQERDAEKAKKLEQVSKGIERAAGGVLAEVK